MAAIAMDALSSGDSNTAPRKPAGDDAILIAIWTRDEITLKQTAMIYERDAGKR